MIETASGGDAASLGGTAPVESSIVLDVAAMAAFGPEADARSPTRASAGVAGSE